MSNPYSALAQHLLRLARGGMVPSYAQGGGVGDPAQPKPNVQTGQQGLMQAGTDNASGGNGPQFKGPPQFKPGNTPTATPVAPSFNAGSGDLRNSYANDKNTEGQNVAGLSPISTFQAQGPTSNLQFQQAQLDHSGYGNAVNQGMQQAGETYGNQSALAKSLMAQANGGGPNLAAQQERQATDRNIAQSFAMAQANANNPGAQRMLAQQAGQMNQQAAADSATQRMQQQLAAQEQLAGVLGTQGQQSLGLLGTSGGLQNAQNANDITNLSEEEKYALQQNMANQNANLTAQGINAGTANQNAARVAGAIGGVANAVGPAVMQAWSGLNGGGGGSGGTPDAQYSTPAPSTPYTPEGTGGVDYNDLGGGVDGGTTDGGGMAHGGLVHALVRHYANGGDVGPDPIDTMLQKQDASLNPLNFASQGSAPPIAPVAKPEDHSAWGHKDTPADTVIKALPFGGLFDMAGRAIGQAGESIGDALGMNKMYRFNGGPPLKVAEGGAVPGKAQVMGDSSKNDRVPAVLSPGEIVLPRSVATSDNAPDKAAAFVAAIKKQKGEAKASSPKSFGELLSRVRDIRAQLAALEGSIKGAK